MCIIRFDTIQSLRGVSWPSVFATTLLFIFRLFFVFLFRLLMDEGGQILTRPVRASARTP